MKRTLAIFPLAAILMIGLALASGQAFARSAKTMSAPTAASFVHKAAIGGMTEIKLSERARQKTSDANVRKFADRMVTDHTAANAKLRTIAQGDDLAMPTALDAKSQAVLDRLQIKSGADFDRAYAAKMENDHVGAVKLFKHEASSGKPANLKSFASSTLPTLEEHLKMAKALVHETGAADRMK